MTDHSLHILIVDEEQESIRSLLAVLARKNMRGSVVANAKQAVEFLEKNDVDLAFCSIQIEQPREGIRLIQKIKSNVPELPVIMVGRWNDSNPEATQRLLDVSVQSIQAGCRHFLIKPIAIARIEQLLDTFLSNQPVAAIDAETSGLLRHRIVGKSSKLNQTLDLARRVAGTSMPVLIAGESGTGKELIASLIHHHSQRLHGPYMQVNCAALNGSLLESELFGHEKGAFTGAYTQRKGRFEMAHGGTLLLDEITETPIGFQATLLRVLEQQDFERVGGNDSVRVDVRIISTTNKDLAEEVTEGRFREDLYYRLCGIRLQIPPLRERIEDLPDLVWHFVNLYAGQVSRQITKLSPDMMELFSKYYWPGNIRQLRNVVRTALVLGVGPTLSLADASWLFNELQPRPQRTDLSGNRENTAISNLSGLPLAQVERRAILDTLEQTSGNQTKAAKILGISDRTLRGKIRQYRQQDCLQTV